MKFIVHIAQFIANRWGNYPPKFGFVATTHYPSPKIVHRPKFGFVVIKQYLMAFT